MKKQSSWTKKSEVAYFLDGCLQGCLTADKGMKFEKILFDVLMEIWDKIENEVDRIAYILFADASSLFLCGWPHRPGKGEICNPSKWIIYFPESLCDEPKSEVKYVIAHELAHFMLGHAGGIGREECRRGEKAADELAAKWGFSTKRGGEERMVERRGKQRVKKQDSPTFPMATVAYYGPDDKTATKVVVGILKKPEKVSEIRRWMALPDIRRNEKIANKMADFVHKYKGISVVVAEGIIGCVHEEGKDYPKGEDCPFCSFWKGKQ